MPYRYRLHSGGTIEVDTATEFKELLDLGLLKQEVQSGFQQPSFANSTPEVSNTLIDAETAQPELQQSLVADLAPEASNTVDTVIDVKPLINESSAISLMSLRVPSVEDFCLLWKAIKRETQREVLRMLAKRDNKELTIQELEQHIGERCKGPMGGIGRIFHRVTGFTWTDYFVLNNSKGVYEVNKTAHKNLVTALEIVEPKP